RVLVPARRKRPSTKACICPPCEFSDEFGDTLFAEPACAQLAANVAKHQFRGAAVGGDDPLDLDIALAAAEITHGGQMQAFVEGLFRLAGTRTRHRTTDIAFMRDRTAETDSLAFDKDRRDY